MRSETGSALNRDASSTSDRRPDTVIVYLHLLYLQLASFNGLVKLSAVVDGLFRWYGLDYTVA